MSNFTDVDALAAEPGVVVRFVDRAEELADADLVIVPGTRGTVKALAWLRERGLADALVRRAAEGRPVLGICGGFQVLGERIEDEVESRAGVVDGLGVLPVRIRFDRDKTLARPVGSALGELRGGVRDPPRGGRRTGRGAVPGRVPGGGGVGDALARVAGERRRSGGGSWWRRPGRRAAVRSRAGHEFRGAAGGAAGSARGSGGGACGHGCVVGVDRGGAPAGLPFVPPGAPPLRAGGPESGALPRTPLLNRRRGLISPGPRQPRPTDSGKKLNSMSTRRPCEYAVSLHRDRRAGRPAARAVAERRQSGRRRCARAG